MVLSRSRGHVTLARWPCSLDCAIATVTVSMIRRGYAAATVLSHREPKPGASSSSVRAAFRWPMRRGAFARGDTGGAEGVNAIVRCGPRG